MLLRSHADAKEKCLAISRRDTTLGRRPDVSKGARRPDVKRRRDCVGYARERRGAFNFDGRETTETPRQACAGWIEQVRKRWMPAAGIKGSGVPGEAEAYTIGRQTENDTLIAEILVVTAKQLCLP